MVVKMQKWDSITSTLRDHLHYSLSASASVGSGEETESTRPGNGGGPENPESIGEYAGPENTGMENAGPGQ